MTDLLAAAPLASLLDRLRSPGALVLREDELLIVVAAAVVIVFGVIPIVAVVILRRRRRRAAAAAAAGAAAASARTVATDATTGASVNVVGSGTGAGILRPTGKAAQRDERGTLFSDHRGQGEELRHATEALDDEALDEELSHATDALEVLGVLGSLEGTDATSSDREDLSVPAWPSEPEPEPELASEPAPDPDPDPRDVAGSSAVPDAPTRPAEDPHVPWRAVGLALAGAAVLMAARRRRRRGRLQG